MYVLRNTSGIEAGEVKYHAGELKIISKFSVLE